MLRDREEPRGCLLKKESSKTIVSPVWEFVRLFRCVLIANQRSTDTAAGGGGLVELVTTLLLTGMLHTAVSTHTIHGVQLRKSLLYPWWLPNPNSFAL